MLKSSKAVSQISEIKFRKSGNTSQAAYTHTLQDDLCVWRKQDQIEFRKSGNGGILDENPENFKEGNADKENWTYVEFCFCRVTSQRVRVLFLIFR